MRLLPSNFCDAPLDGLHCRQFFKKRNRQSDQTKSQKKSEDGTECKESSVKPKGNSTYLIPKLNDPKSRKWRGQQESDKVGKEVLIKEVSLYDCKNEDA